MHHALRPQQRERLAEVNQTCVCQHPGEEARVQQMSRGMFRTASIQIYRQPALYRLAVEGKVVGVRAGKTQEVPR